MLFFDPGITELTHRGLEIVTMAMHSIALFGNPGKTIRIEINGYTDTSKTDIINSQGIGLDAAHFALALARANRVADLICKPPSASQSGHEIAISTQGFGDTHLIVPTAPGVQELQNRRVEIVIH
jgi:OmpA-OmpF porin, OOP family